MPFFIANNFHESYNCIVKEDVMAEFKFHSDKEVQIKKLYKFVMIFTVVLVVIAVGFTEFILTFERAAAETFLKQNVMQTASNLKGRVKGDIDDLKLLAANLSAYTSTYSEAEVVRFLGRQVKNEKYHRLGFSYPNGKGISVEEKAGKLPFVDWANEDCFDVALSGKPCLAETVDAPESRSGFVNSYYVPVFDRTGHVKGVMGSQIDSDILKKIIRINDYNGEAYTHVISQDGDYIYKSPNEVHSCDNFFKLPLDYLGKTKEQIQHDLLTKDSGTFWFRGVFGKIFVAAYARIGDTQDFVLTDVPYSVLMYHVNQLLWVIAFIVLIFGAVLISLMKYTHKLYRENEETIYKVAFTDEVTLGANKAKFTLDATELLKEHADKNYAMISFDITKFKAINELYGYKRANKILKDVYQILKRNLSRGSVCARDFAATYIILYRYDKEDFIVKYFVDKIAEEIDKYNEDVMRKLISNTETKVIAKLSIAFGIYLITDKSVPIAQMCDRASLAKRSHKDDVTQIYKFYDDEIRSHLLQDKEIEDEMDKALENHEFKMYLQPKFDMNTMEIVGAEALVRWIHPEKGIIPPINFIPIFEKNGFVIKLDKEMWKQACEFLSNRKKSGAHLFPVSVNVSRLHLNNDAFIDELVKLTKDYDIETKYLELELTESACLNNEKHFSEIMDKLKSLGFIISMDDFGTGYSSLNMLRRLPVDVLKLDRGFICDSIAEEKGKIVVRKILDMANELNIVTVAEGIETSEQAMFLKNAGCKIAQGFLYGRPLDVETFINTFLSGENSICQE